MIRTATLRGEFPAILICILAAVVMGLLLGTTSGLKMIVPVGALVLLLLLIWDIRLVVPVLAVSLPFGPKFALSFGNLYLSTAILIVAYLAWGVRIAARGIGLTFQSNAIVVAVLAFMGAFVVSSIQGFDYLLSDTAPLLKFMQFLLYTGIFVMVYQMEFSRQQIKHLLVFLLLVGVAQGAYGAVQWIRNPGFFVYGTFDTQHNLYASYVTFILVIMVGIALEAKRLQVIIASLVAAGIILYSIVFSFSRTAYISLVVSFVLFAFLPIAKLKRVVVPAVPGALTACILLVVPTAVSERMRDILTTAAGSYVTLSFKYRLMLWQEAFEDFKRAPIFGQGAWVSGMRDNFFVKAAAESGIVGLGTFLILIYLILRESWRLVHSPPADSFMRGFVVGFFPAAVGALIVRNMAGDSMSIHRFMGVFWIALALMLQYCSANRSSTSEPPHIVKHGV